MAAFTPFFFRLFSEDGQSGIMYLAQEEFREAYDCAGARQIGMHKGKAVWYIAGRDRGGYTDVMPEAAMFDYQTVFDTEECNEKIRPPNDETTLFTDEKSYWFVDDSLLRQECQTKSKSKSKTKTKTKTKKKSKNYNEW